MLKKVRKFEDVTLGYPYGDREPTATGTHSWYSPDHALKKHCHQL